MAAVAAMPRHGLHGAATAAEQHYRRTVSRNRRRLWGGEAGRPGKTEWRCDNSESRSPLPLQNAASLAAGKHRVLRLCSCDRKNIAVYGERPRLFGAEPPGMPGNFDLGDELILAFKSERTRIGHHGLEESGIAGLAV